MFGNAAQIVLREILLGYICVVLSVLAASLMRRVIGQKFDQTMVQGDEASYNILRRLH